MRNKIGLFLSLTFFAQVVNGQTATPRTDLSKFRQLGQELPTPNTYRAASGAPGHQYWQQRADYQIAVTLDDAKQSVKGFETITYYNNSPDNLDYLWVQLDQNIFQKESDSYLTRTGGVGESMSLDEVAGSLKRTFDGGYKIENVKDASGKPLQFVINKTMMRVNLPAPLKARGVYKFSIAWSNFINDNAKNGGRGAFEYFPEDQNYLYEMAQWFPRMAVYDDVWGWQHKQYLGTGEFALEFGNYDVKITVPADHIVAATGELQNAGQVLTSKQQERWRQAAKSQKPVCIVTQDEAVEAEKSKAKGVKTWHFYAKDVRDFAWASSRKFIWDAMRVNVEGRNVWAMSYYPKEGNPLWGQYSTRIVAHTLKSYSRHSLAYPYPVAISVHGPVFGMEYPMICFNGGRPDKDGTYSERLKYSMLSVIIHEVGHNFFPMIVSSDERQWSWMDEGLNTFLQFLAEKEWDKNFPATRGEPVFITDYMKSDKNGQVPIMTNSESVLQFGNNAYGKPATALNILRETILGRELFDFAFKTYCRRWAFKHPNPADFFRTMEDASGTDLDWFWRGWFYTTDHVDIAITGVTDYVPKTMDPAIDKVLAKKDQFESETSVSRLRGYSAEIPTVVETDTGALDFYNKTDMAKPLPSETKAYQDLLASITDEQKNLLKGGYHFYKIDFKNLGGLVMPLVLKMDFEKGGDTLIRIPAEIWRYNSEQISKTFAVNKAVKSFELDPYLETADCDLVNNSWPRRPAISRFKMFKQMPMPARSNPMRELRQSQDKK